MAFFDKLNRMAKTIGEFTNDAIEAGRSGTQLQADRSAAKEQFRIIGEYYYNVYASGGEVAEEVLSACETAKQHMDAIAAAEEAARLRKEEEERQRREAEEQEAAACACPECGAPIGEGVRFCGRCGAKVQSEVPAERRCPECGCTVAPDMRFCGECGCRMEP